MRVLIGYDGSQLADAALVDLHRAGLPADVEVVVLSAADVVMPPNLPAEAIVSEPQIARELERWRALVEATLAETQAVAERAAVRVRTEFPRWSVAAESVADSPGWAMIRRAEGSADPTWRADLLVVGAAGLSGIERIIFGSVAHQVLTNAPCSTRVSRAPKRPRGADPIRLIVGVDGSTDADAAVRAVAARTWPAGTQCRVISVVDSRLASALPPKLLPMILTPELAAQHVAGAGVEILRAAGLAASVAVKRGGAARQLVKEAEEFEADCIFVGARGLSHVERFMLGSVSTSVAMRAGCSVEVVHPAQR
jgi:nucleotide-binding universal stress UspA family protein